jgi:hypothetical protein
MTIDFPLTDYSQVPIGGTWKIPLDYKYEEETFEEFWRDFLSNEFRASGRNYVIYIRLPSGTDFCPDFKATDKRKNGWTVTGELPRISVSPSVNEVGRYHGWIKEGVLSDDLDGRVFR